MTETLEQAVHPLTIKHTITRLEQSLRGPTFELAEVNLAIGVLRHIGATLLAYRLEAGRFDALTNRDVADYFRRWLHVPASVKAAREQNPYGTDTPRRRAFDSYLDTAGSAAERWYVAEFSVAALTTEAIDYAETEVGDAEQADALRVNVHMAEAVDRHAGWAAVELDLTELRVLAEVLAQARPHHLEAAGFTTGEAGLVGILQDRVARAARYAERTRNEALREAVDYLTGDEDLTKVAETLRTRRTPEQLDESEGRAENMIEVASGDVERNRHNADLVRIAAGKWHAVAAAYAVEQTRREAEGEL